MTNGAGDCFTGEYQYFRANLKLRLLEIPYINYLHFITDINKKCQVKLANTFLLLFENSKK